jgi:hypothetical protein
MTEKTQKQRRKPRVRQRLIASADAARLLGIEPDTLRKRALRGFAPEPFARQGNLYYYRLADIEHFAEHGVWPAGLKFRGQEEVSWAPPDEPGGSG